jgi:hypothetical protein
MLSRLRYINKQKKNIALKESLPNYAEMIKHTVLALDNAHVTKLLKETGAVELMITGKQVKLVLGEDIFNTCLDKK